MKKVVERTGSTIQKYPSIAKSYQISYIKNEKKPKQMLRVDWEIKDLSAMESISSAAMSGQFLNV